MYNAVTVFIALLALIGCSDFRQSRYTNMDDARNRGAVARGWVPECLPEQATNIAERHNIDTNELWGEMDVQGEVQIRSQCSIITPAALAGKQITSPGGWWPTSLTGRLEESKLHASGLSFWKDASHGETYIAIDPKVRKGYFWSANRG